MVKWYNPFTYKPMTHEGRQTLIYFVFAASGPVLTALIITIMHLAIENSQWGVFNTMAWFIALSLLVTNISLGMFVALRAIKISKDGIEAEGYNQGS